MIPALSGLAGWHYYMSLCPRERKCLLLTHSGVAVIGCIKDDEDTKSYIAWSPLPDRDKDKEKELRL
jgi:hypothetical protein